MQPNSQQHLCRPIHAWRSIWWHSYVSRRTSQASAGPSAWCRHIAVGFALCSWNIWYPANDSWNGVTSRVPQQSSDFGTREGGRRVRWYRHINSSGTRRGRRLCRVLSTSVRRRTIVANKRRTRWYYVLATPQGHQHTEIRGAVAELLPFVDFVDFGATWMGKHL